MTEGFKSFVCGGYRDRYLLYSKAKKFLEHRKTQAHTPLTIPRAASGKLHHAFTKEGKWEGYITA
jgi:hypothetical protein